MHRIQVQLTEQQERALRELASLRGASISALIREGVDRLIDSPATPRAQAIERFRSIMGTYNEPDGRTDVAMRHDEYLAETAHQDLVGRQ
ncbi:MAG: CopG family transcriptional regulator [Candidatus Eremiobacteraeota bacterium]|nr:CopG family transcriptional regulator [Candidatus Eremiobacteraeota bacterium]